MSAAPDQQHVTLEVSKDHHKSLVEPNSIVRYFSMIGSKPWGKAGEDVLKDYALIEYEETVLSPAVSTNALEALALAELVIVKNNLAAEPPSPAEIVLFSTLYDIASTAKIHARPALAAWFSRVVGTPWARAAIEKVAVLTTVEPTKKSKSAPAAEDTSERVYVKKIKEGTAMRIPDEGEPMLVPPHPVAASIANPYTVFLLLVKRIFLLPLPYLM